MTVYVAIMGSPVVLLEKLVAGTEISSAFKGMAKMLSTGVLGKSSDFGRKSDGGLEIKQLLKHPGVYGAAGLENVKSSKGSLVSYLSCVATHIVS